MKIVIVGAGKVGYYLTKELLKKGHKVVVIDTREKAAAQIANDPIKCYLKLAIMLMSLLH